MSIHPFTGETFVAFTDIAGFKSMMEDERAAVALDAFYSVGYNVLHHQRQGGERVEGLFISDSAVLFVGRNTLDPTAKLRSLCLVLQEIHRRTFENAIQLTSSIAWGEFSYHERIEFPGIRKDPIFGNGYISAYMDNEIGQPKLYPSECRVVRKNLPQTVTDFCAARVGTVAQQMRVTRDHFYYEWMRAEGESLF